MAALLLARLDQTPDNLKLAVELALASLQHIVLKTYEYTTTQANSDPKSPEVTSYGGVPELSGSDTETNLVHV